MEELQGIGAEKLNALWLIPGLRFAQQSIYPASLILNPPATSLITASKSNQEFQEITPTLYLALRSH